MERTQGVHKVQLAEVIGFKRLFPILEIGRMKSADRFQGAYAADQHIPTITCRFQAGGQRRYACPVGNIHAVAGNTLNQPLGVFRAPVSPGNRRAGTPIEAREAFADAAGDAGNQYVPGSHISAGRHQNGPLNQSPGTSCGVVLPNRSALTLRSLPSMPPTVSTISSARL